MLQCYKSLYDELKTICGPLEYEFRWSKSKHPFAKSLLAFATEHQDPSLIFIEVRHIVLGY